MHIDAQCIIHCCNLKNDFRHNQKHPPISQSQRPNNRRKNNTHYQKTAHTMKIAFTLALLTATAMLMAKGNQKNTRRQFFTQKRQRSAA